MRRRCKIIRASKQALKQQDGTRLRDAFARADERHVLKVGGDLGAQLHAFRGRGGLLRHQHAAHQALRGRKPHSAIRT